MILVIVACAVVLRAFFMPWARMKTTVVDASKEITGRAEGFLSKLPEGKRILKGLKKATDAIDVLGDVEVESTLSGFSILALANLKVSKTALSLSQILFKETKDLDKRLLLIYLVPLSAIICVMLALVGLKYKLAVLLMLVLSGGISIPGLYNLNTLDLSGPSVRIVAEPGIWYTLYAFLAIFAIGILWLALDRGK